VIALRLLFHFPDLAPLLREMRRIVRPGGSLVFDTYRWTPRSIVPLMPGRWGGRIFVHADDRLRRLATELGLTVARAEDCFLCSPYLCRLLPLGAVRRLERLEDAIPPHRRARTFWKLTRG
jgi:SAM-dependent methyltransferase